MAYSMDGSHLYWIPSATAEPVGPEDGRTGSHLPLLDLPCPAHVHTGSHLPLLDLPGLQMSILDPICHYWTCRTLQIPSRCPYRTPSACPGLRGPADGHIRSHLPLLDLLGPADTSRCPYWIPSGGWTGETDGIEYGHGGGLGWSRRSR